MQEAVGASKRSGVGDILLHWGNCVLQSRHSLLGKAHDFES